MNNTDATLLKLVFEKIVLWVIHLHICHGKHAIDLKICT